MRRSKSVFEPTVDLVMFLRMQNEGLCIYHRWNGKSDKFELINRSCEHVEWVHPDTWALLRHLLRRVGEYKTVCGDVITVYDAKKGK